VETEGPLEVLAGKLTCDRCGKKFEVKRGVPDLLFQPSEIIVNEVAGNQEMLEKERKTFGDEWLLGLPAKFKPKGERIEINTSDAIGKLKLTGKETILELGAGTTWLSARLANSFGCNVVATDILREKFIGLESADVYMNRLGTFYERVLCQMERLPFQNNTFDIVICYASIHHAEKILDAFAEASRVLKAGGRFVLLHEGVSGVLRNNSVIGYDYQSKNPYEWNEHTYWAAGYLRLARRFGLDPRVFWPAFLLNLDALGEQNFADMSFGAIAKRLVPLFKLNCVKRLFDTKLLLMFALFFFGIPLNMIATKRG